MFWKFVVSALLLPSCLGFETAAAHLVNKAQNQPQSQESTLPVTSTLANQNLMNSSTLAIQSNFEADTPQVKQTKYDYYQRIQQQRLRRSRQRVRSAAIDVIIAGIIETALTIVKIITPDGITTDTSVNISRKIIKDDTTTDANIIVMADVTTNAA